MLRRYLEPAYAFLIAVAFVPGISGAATSPRWTVAALSLWFLDWRVLWFPAVCFAVLEFDQACHWAIVSGAFCWGMNNAENTKRTFTTLPVTLGFCAGIAISGAIAIAQATVGFSTIPQAISPAGLFVNKNVMGEAAVLAFIAAASARLWPAALICVPAVILSQSRAAWLATFAGLFMLASFRMRCLLLSLALLLSALFWFTGFELSTSSLMERFAIWRDAISHLTLFGNGSYDYSTVQHREPNLHNDWLQFVYELGIVGLIPIAVVGFAGISGGLPFVAALFVLGSFGFPLHNPASAWFAAFIIGYFVRVGLNEGRISIRPWHQNPQLC